MWQHQVQGDCGSLLWDDKTIHKLLNDVIVLFPLILRITFQSPLSFNGTRIKPLL